MRIFVALIILMLISPVSISAMPCDLIGRTKKNVDFSFGMENVKRIGDDIIPYEMLFHYKDNSFKEYSAEHCIVHFVYNDNYVISSGSTIKCSKKDGNPFSNVFYKFNKKTEKFVCMEGCTELIPKTLYKEDCNAC